MKKNVLTLLAFTLFAFSSSFAQYNSTLAADIIPGIDASMPSYLTAFNGKLYFSATDNTFDEELWQYDGTTASRLADINTTGSSYPTNFKVFNNKLYFYADNGINGAELFVYDGANTPSLVADINTGINNSFITNLEVFNGKLYFDADDGINGVSLWQYDGISAPSIVSGGEGISPSYLKVYNNKLYFKGTDGANGAELWQYDGTLAPSLVQDIYTGTTGSFPSYLTVFNNKLFFNADDGVNGNELWQYDGAIASMAADINSGAFLSNPTELTTFKNKLYFSADDGINGTELYVFDGTTASLVYDINVGSSGSTVSKLITYRDTLYFSAWDGNTGEELWHYGGAGVPWMEDLNLGSGGSFYNYPAVLGGKLYFQSDNGTTGSELYYINTCTTTTSTITPVACGTYTSPSGLVKTTSQTFVDIIPNHIGCDSLITINLTINTPPTASISGTTSACQGDLSAPQITFTGANGTIPYTFFYKINGGSLQTITTSASNSITISASTAVAGTFNYELQSVEAGGCSQSQTGNAVATINAKPTATLTGNASVCQNATSPVLSFTTNGGVNPYTLYYNINGGSSLNITIPTGNLATISAPTANYGAFIYTLQGVADGNGCGQLTTQTTTITVNPLPVVDLGPDLLVSSFTPFSLNAKNVGSTYAWSNAQTTQVVSITNIGTYSVSVTNAFGCSASDNFSVGLMPAVTLYVNDNAAGANNGTNWTNAYTSLTTALSNVKSGDTIMVAAGTYQPASGQSFIINKNIHIYGGFAGTENYLHQRNLALGNTSTLQGNGQGVVKFEGSKVTSATVFDGFTVTGGNSATLAGGGINIFKSSPIIQNCIVKNNTTPNSSGGGIWNTIGSPTIINCLVVGNTAKSAGGIFISGTATSKAKIINCTIAANTASGATGGGGINVSNANVVISNSIIYGNTGPAGKEGLVGNNVTNYCLVQGLAADAAKHNLDGTATLDLFVDAANGNYQIKPSSNTINAGSNALIPAGLTKDLAGNTRTFDNNVDMGAYELQTVQPPLDGVMCVKPGGAGLMNGNGWANAYANLQAAINFSATTTTKVVAVAVGTYTPAAGQSFSMKEGVNIMGGFVGTETHINQRDLSITSYTTVLKGNGSAVINNANSNITNAAILDGFTITGGKSGIYNLNSSPNIINCRISGNNADYGGGITNSNSIPNIINCSISGNTTSKGALIDNTYSNPSIINCSISGNTANYGGVIYNGFSNPSIINCSISGNTSSKGGVIYNGFSNPSIINCIIYGNTTVGSGIDGFSSNPTIKNSLVQGIGADAANGNPNGNLNWPNLFIDAANGDLRLNLLGALFSGAINGGSDAAVPSHITTDLDGNNRKNNVVDMGCYELGSIKATNITVSTNPNWVIKNSRNILRETVMGNPEQKDLQTNFALLQMAIDAAYPGDSIFVEKGIYEQGLDTALVMKDSVHVFGGFNGTETTFAERDLSAGHTTILRGNGTSVIINDDNGLTNLAELNGFTLENGTGKDVDGLTYGGAIYNYNASPTISNCIIKNNQADYGGAIFNDNNSKPAILRSQLLNNTAYGDGAAVYSNYSSSASITNCLIKGNTANQDGGAVYANFMSDNKISNSTIVNNNASFDGGALVANSSTISMANSIVLNNTASSNAGVYAYNAGATNITYSLTQGITTGTGNLNGATTYTLFVNEATNNYRLKCGVAAIDAGNNDSIPSNGKTDLAQNARTYDGTVDLGAYEYGAFSRPKAAKRQTVCSNGDIVFKSYISDESGATYQWMKAPNGSNTFTAIGSAIKDSLLLSAVAQADSGSRYFVQITNGCGILHSDTMTLKVNRLPVLNFGPDKAVCLNEDFALQANNYGEMLWNDGSNNASLPTLISDEYWLQVTDMNGCVAKDTINIIVNTVDTVVTVNLSTLTVSHANASSYQWIKSDGVSSYTLVSGETNQTFVATQDGSYAVIVNTAEGCVDTSAYKTIVNASIVENGIAKSIFGVYPNPTNGEITISATEVIQQIEITDVMGRVVYKEKPIATKHTLSLATEPKGVYFVKVSAKDNTDIIKIIKQ